ncbi:MAG: BON domain-containing protein [Syntrophomonadaceae bacterium]|nr:BON domain-containing protein [Syntrophomonadaceae bacterium]
MSDRNISNELQQQVQSLLEKDKDLRGYGLKADVVQGEVQLQGVVDTLQEKERAEELVQQVPGIKGVVNAISISTDGAITDKNVAMEVQEELELSPDVNIRHIGAELTGGNGTVVLKGQADDPDEMEAARKAASKARGVTKVVSQVKLGGEALDLPGIFHSQVNNDRD